MENAIATTYTEVLALAKLKMELPKTEWEEITLEGYKDCYAEFELKLHPRKLQYHNPDFGDGRIVAEYRGKELWVNRAWADCEPKWEKVS